MYIPGRGRRIVCLQWYWESEGVFFFSLLDGIFDLDRLAISFFIFGITTYLVFILLDMFLGERCVIWASWDGLILSFFVCLIIVFS